MFKKILFLFLIIIATISFAQINSTTEINITGIVCGEIMENDSIYFNSGSIDKKYFEEYLVSSKISSDTFNLEIELSYPQMYRVLFFSDKKKRIRRPGKYFIDQSTNFIATDYLSEECTIVNGKNSDEYKNQFIPFILKTGYDCKSADMEKAVYNKTTEYDSILFNYVIKYPDSYVALWSLIERVSLFGHTELREKTLEHFTKKIKEQKIWALLYSDLENAQLKENKEFPIFSVKNIELKKQNLYLPKAKYTLIDFWFSRCRPCLDTLPALKKLYSKYNSRGFEIVSISTDKNTDSTIWQKRVKENELFWFQYIDEGGIETKKLNINSFPTFILLNDKNEIIKKYISLDDVDYFLNNHLEN